MRAIRDYYVAASAVVVGDVVLSRDVNIWYNCVVRGDLATITFEPGVNLQDGCVVHTDSDASMLLQEGVVVGHGAILHGRSIGKDTLVGMGAVLLSGCEIGEECLIAAGTVVPEGREIPTRSVVMGVPGKVVRQIKPEELEETRRISRNYVEEAQLHVREAFLPPWEQK
ncbi:MAG: gamma carbonic anhydrase family protein [Gemmataceae bacterium]